MTITRVLLCLLVLASCSSSKGGSDSGVADASASDTHGETGADARAMFSDGMFKVVSAKGLEFEGPSTAALLTSYAGACTHATARAGVSGAATLFFGVADIGADGKSAAITAAGTYSIFSGTAAPASSHAAEAFMAQTDSACLPADEVRATAGSITITAATTTGLEGTYVLTFPGVGQVSGSFVAPACEGFDPNSSVVTTCGST